jgi:thiol-disulfide isomerase/thioredoxin
MLSTVLALLLLAQSPAPQSAPQVLFFTASWCHVCPAAKVEVDQARRQGVLTTELDFDLNRGLAQQYRITQVPTLVFLDAGHAERYRFVGVLPTASILSYYNALPR